ncbi:MAG: sulfatase-like hydrolase/transferase [Planctomycetota bacterium]
MSLPHRSLVAVTACCLVAFTVAPAVAAAPNVVLILSDDQHWGDYGFMGHEHLRTPALDRLARESLVFTRGYVPASLCCPSLASLITGRYPHEHKIVGNDPPEPPANAVAPAAVRAAFDAGRERMNRHLEAWPLLPKLLGAHGYRSLQTGKWWQGDFRRGGFDEGMTKGQRHGDEGLAIGRATMQPVYEFVRRCRQAGQPFFVWYAPMLPHDPHDPPAELVDHYASLTDSVHVARYWGNVERFDRTVGELLEFLDAEALAADTLVVYVTDNGWIQRPDAPRFAPRSKLSPYDGGLRTPIMLRRPGTIAPATSEALASSLDIMPTVLAACGVPAPAGLPGVNLLDEQAVAARTQLFGACSTHTLLDLDDPARSLMWRWTVRREGDHLWKLIEPVTARGGGPVPAWEGRLVAPEDQARYERGEVELFDVAADPRETENLASERPGLVAELQASLDTWWPAAARKPGGPPLPAGPEATPVTGAAAARPNLLVFLADDLGARDLGCTGSSFYRTPAIDRLAAAGMTFTRGYAAAPVCSPTRAALITGRHPARVRITNFITGKRRGLLVGADFLQALPEAEVTVPELLQAAGYTTGVFGKWHLGPPEDIPKHGFDATGSTTVGPGSGPIDDPLHARAIARQAAAFITEAAAAGKPWFCYVPMHSVHVPLMTRPDLAAEEGRRAVGVGPRFDVPAPPTGDPVTRSVQDHPVYAGMIREMDETVAGVLAAVEQAGQTDETLVVFTSDNGGLATAEGAPTSNLPLRAGKGFVREGGIRVPLLVRWPGVVAPGTSSDVPVTTLDIAATLLDAAGCERPAGQIVDGASLRPVLAGSGPLAARDLVWHYPHYSNQGGRPAAALLAGDGPTPGTDKLVEHFEDGRLELFDLAIDPGERHDLAAERPARVEELHGRLVAWREQVAAALAKPNPEPVEPHAASAMPRRPRGSASR